MDISEAIRVEVKQALADILKSVLQSLNDTTVSQKSKGPKNKRNKPGQKEIEPTSRAGIVLDTVIKSGKPLTSGDVVNITKFPQGVVAPHLLRLVQRGLLSRIRPANGGPWEYTVR